MKTTSKILLSILLLALVLMQACAKQVGDVITFGHYEQDNDPTNGKEPIKWRILDKNASGQYLVISEKALDVQRYNTTKISITWEKSKIRSWLNGYGSSYNTVGTDFTSDNFIDAAFTAEEKAKIVASNVPAHANPIILDINNEIMYTHLNFGGRIDGNGSKNDYINRC